MANPVGRPKKEIDWNLVRNLCGIQCTGEEIASILDIHYDTLNNHCNHEFGENFSDYYKKASSTGKMSLRRKQWEVGMSGNVPMLIFLGKNTLGQSDQRETKHDHQPITIEIVNPHDGED